MRQAPAEERFAHRPKDEMERTGGNGRGARTAQETAGGFAVWDRAAA